MNPQETLQADTRDETWVPSAKRVKISSTNIRLETTVPQMEETFQVIIDVIKNSTCFKAFTISADVPEIFMQQFWYTIKKIIPKKIRGKGSKGKKTFEKSQETVNVSKESKPQHELAKNKTASKGVVKKKVTPSADENIISDDPNAALELAKSISQTKAEEAEATRKIHATHARIMTESASESAKKKSGISAPSLTPTEQEAANIMQALKESKKTSRRQSGTEGLNEGTGSKPGVPDESIVIYATSSEGTGAKPGVLDEDKDITKEKAILEWGDEQDSEFSDDDNDESAKKDDKDGDVDDEGNDHVSDTQDADDKDVKTKFDEDDIYKYKIRVCKDDDVEMKDAEVDESNKGEEKTQSPSVSVIPETTNVPPILEIISETLTLTAVPSPQVTPILSFVQQTPTPIPTQPITTDAPTITTAIPEFVTLFDVELRVAKLKKKVSELKIVDHSSKALVFLQSQVPTVVDSYLDSKHLIELTKKPTPTAEQESEKSPSKILKIKKEQAKKQKKLEFTIKSTDNIEDENAMDKGVANTVKDHKRKHDDDEDDDDEDPPARPNQGKKTKRRKWVDRKIKDERSIKRRIEMSSGTATTDLFNMIIMKNFIFWKRNIRMSSGTATTNLFDIKAKSFKLG
nr:hypothetical protein [Tanacetum cinerariifolium]